MMDLEALIQRAADENGLDPAQLRALIGIESAGDPNALSPKGAMGLMQLMPGTAREMGVTDPNDPEQNIMGGAKYFRQQLDTFGDPALAAAAYNAGPAAVRKYGGVPPYRETRNYVNQFSRRMGMGGMAPGADASAYGEIGDPTAMAMAALPEVSRSAVDMDTIQSTMRVADKLTSGGVTGSLTSPSDREANSTGALAAEMIPTWQTAQKLLNPVNLLQLPMRALRMVDYTLRTAAGAPTLTDSAEQALGFINSGETIMRDPTATARDAAQQELTTAKGLRGQILNPAQKLVHIFTTDPFEGERNAITAERVFRARLAGQRELDKTMQGRIERDQKYAEAPLEIAQKDVNLRKSQAELPYAGRKAAAEVRNLEALPDYRRQSLISQGLGIQRSMATMPDELGRTPDQRYNQNRNTMLDLQRIEDEARRAREREQDRADRETARNDAMQFRQDTHTDALVNMATRAKDANIANTILRNTPYMAKPRVKSLTDPSTWLNSGFDIVPKDEAAPAAAAPTGGGSAGGIDGLRGEIAAQVRDKFKARMGRPPTQRELDEGVAYELNRRNGAR